MLVEFCGYCVPYSSCLCLWVSEWECVCVCAPPLPPSHVCPLWPSAERFQKGAVCVWGESEREREREREIRC